MVEIEEAIKTYLLETTDGVEDERLQALISLRALVGEDIYLGDPEDDTNAPVAPYIIIQVGTETKQSDLSGLVHYESPPVQLTIYASSRQSRKAVGDLMQTALVDFSGNMSGLNIQWIEMNFTHRLEYKSPDGAFKVFTLDHEYQVNYDY